MCQSSEHLFVTIDNKQNKKEEDSDLHDSIMKILPQSEWKAESLEVFEFVLALGRNNCSNLNKKTTCWKVSRAERTEKSTQLNLSTRPN